MTRPLCVWCAKPMPKKTRTLYFGRSKTGPNDVLEADDYTDKPRSIEEVQRLTNHKVVKVSYWPETDGGRYICMASTWDGESYGSSTASFSTKLCSGKCAKEMGLAAAENGFTSKAYVNKKDTRS